MVQYWTDMVGGLKDVKDKMQKWSGRSWAYMLVHQGDFEEEINECSTIISDYLVTFMAASHMEIQVHHKEDEKWKRNLVESLDADHKAVMNELAAANFPKRIMESGVTENDRRTISRMMQRGLAAVSEAERKRMAENLYELLWSSGRIPPDRLLNSGEVEWSGEIPTEGSKNVDMYRGRYLNSQNVRIKVIRSVDMKDENCVERIRREVEMWVKIFDVDRGSHIIPFYGFYSPDGLRLALVSPWIDNGNALAYVKNHDRLVNYKSLIVGIAQGIKVLHSMDPPIIHGNLRAEKILIGKEGQPLITDFALAKLEGNLITQTTGESDSCRWRAPEVFEEQAAVSARCDIYSFGMTILELFTHEIPYAEIKKFLQVVYKKKEMDGVPSRPLDPRVIERGLDDRMWELLLLCWSYDPEDRPLIDELVTQLSQL
ncbi:hypothetical protein AX14_000540 [Amanita brunnescens Koide BX004]|nr:hypothetical protein AX14_000540 [Amanita brunnescens Koide BX004]